MHHFAPLCCVLSCSIYAIKQSVHFCITNSSAFNVTAKYTMGHKKCHAFKNVHCGGPLDNMHVCDFGLMGCDRFESCKGWIQKQESVMYLTMFNLRLKWTDTTYSLLSMQQMSMEVEWYYNMVQIQNPKGRSWLGGREYHNKLLYLTSLKGPSSWPWTMWTFVLKIQWHTSVPKAQPVTVHRDSSVTACSQSSPARPNSTFNL